MYINKQTQVRRVLIHVHEKISNLGKKRYDLTPYQEQVLVKRFQVNPYLEPGEKNELAPLLNMSIKSIVQWFRVRRYYTRKKGLLRKYTKSNIQ